MCCVCPSTAGCLRGPLNCPINGYVINLGSGPGRPEGASSVEHDNERYIGGHPAPDAPSDRCVTQSVMASSAIKAVDPGADDHVDKHGRLGAGRSVPPVQIAFPAVHGRTCYIREHGRRLSESCRGLESSRWDRLKQYLWSVLIRWIVRSEMAALLFLVTTISGMRERRNGPTSGWNSAMTLTAVDKQYL